MSTDRSVNNSEEEPRTTEIVVLRIFAYRLRLRMVVKTLTMLENDLDH
jgi:hypothetical protein